MSFNFSVFIASVIVAVIGAIVITVFNVMIASSAVVLPHSRSGDLRTTGKLCHQ